MRHLSFILSFIVALALPGSPASAGAPGSQDAGTVTVKANVKSAIRFYSNCGVGNSIPGISGLAEHGKIEVVAAVKTACGKPNQQVVVVSYTPQPGFTGVDMVELFAGRQPFTVKVIVQ